MKAFVKKWLAWQNNESTPLSDLCAGWLLALLWLAAVVFVVCSAAWLVVETARHVRAVLQTF